MSAKVIKLLDKLLQHTQLTAQELLASGVDWKVNEKGVYIFCTSGNHHYKIEDSELTADGYLFQYYIFRHILTSCKLHRNKKSIEANVSPISTQSVNQISETSIERRYSSPMHFNHPKRLNSDSSSDSIVNFTSRIAATPTLLCSKGSNIPSMNKIDLNEWCKANKYHFVSLFNKEISINLSVLCVLLNKLRISVLQI